MNYPLTSVAQIVGSVIRRTGLKDTSIIVDLNEWIAEAMQLLQTSVALEKSFEQVEVKFHKGKYPCGLAELWAIEYCGTRLRYNNGVRDPRASWNPAASTDIFDAVFVSTTTKENTPTGNYLYDSEFQKAQSLKWNGTEWYKTDGRYILTSFETGCITLFFGRVPLDRDGFLMIPDEGNYKEALRCFLRACIAGRQGSEQMESKWMARFDIHQARAISNITYPSPDQAQATADTLARLLPDVNYYEGFFTTIGPEPSYDL